ncbi:RibD family protein [filamentous cyanobacterium LEGE 11480]|uniref:RibD family protein n=1 Tax=Romeriopsis navalis LEGE 11480 TaxID=2777977 RepID=A0A928Z318_9CYAN|nr:RibD family protein [Romeriopsis navalis]MBE9029612.1 RibD family protein [Romeriopsis navalis LEGE 11480]
MVNDAKLNRPHVTAILAMSADGKLADYQRSAGRFGSPQDQRHLEEQVAAADLVLFGAGTLRAYGTTMSVQSPALKMARVSAGKPVQPIQMVCSASGELDASCDFFAQPIPRWLLTTTSGAKAWSAPQFDRVWSMGRAIDWPLVMQEFTQAGIETVALLGGGTIVASFLEAGLIDEIWLTVCPLILGGATAPTPVQSSGWLEDVAPRLQLIAARPIEDEVFLHYRVKSA